MLEIPTSDAASLILMVPGSTWVSHSGRSGWSVQVELADEGRVAADDDHGQQVGDHGDVDQRQDTQHE